MIGISLGTICTRAYIIVNSTCIVGVFRTYIIVNSTCMVGVFMMFFVYVAEIMLHKILNFFLLEIILFLCFCIVLIY
jgi:hypothetical protein